MSEKPLNDESKVAEKSKKDWKKISDRDTDALASSEDENQMNAKEQITEPLLADIPEEVDSLQEQLTLAKNEAAKNYDLFLRTKAEMDNLSRRARIDLENAYKFSIKKIVEDLIPVLDGMEQGLQTQVNESDEHLKQMHTGLQLTYNILLETVQKYGIEQLNPVGEKFNPELHEAIAMEESKKNESSGTVISVFQKGYCLNGRLLRPARVVVAK